MGNGNGMRTGLFAGFLIGMLLFNKPMQTKLKKALQEAMKRIEDGVKHNDL